MMTNFDGIPFHVRADDRSGVYTDWVITPHREKTQVPYSNITITESIGHAPARVTWRLFFEKQNREDYYAFLAKLGVTGTLTVLATFQSLKGTQKTMGNPPQVYEVLDQVSIEEISDQALFVDGTTECTVTFERMVDPVTRLAVVP